MLLGENIDIPYDLHRSILLRKNFWIEMWFSNYNTKKEKRNQHPCNSALSQVKVNSDKI